MNADPELRERLQRAAAGVSIDTEWRLGEIHRSAPRRRRVRRVGTLAVALVFALASVGVAWQLLRLRAGPTTPGTDIGLSGRIAYMRLTKPLTQKDSSDLFVLDAGSGKVAALHEGTGFSVWPQFSPDGSRLAYASNETRQGGTGIFVAQADGTEPVDIIAGRPLQDGGPVSLGWSPDGSRIAFVGKDLRTGQTGVWTVEPDGTDRRLVLDGRWDSVSWSPDGERLLLAGAPAGAEQSDLHTIRPDGSSLRQLTDDQAVERSPTWSPDGTRIVFSESTVAFDNADYGQDVFVMDADGSNLRQVTEWKGFDSFPVWAPNGKWIVFASDRDASPDQQLRNGGGKVPLSGVSIYVMRPDGSGVARVLDGGAVAVLPSSWTP
jgi:Tol biopolymer transport system component